MKNFIAMLTMLHVSVLLLQGNGSTAVMVTKVENYVENDYGDTAGEDVEYTSFAVRNEYKDSHETVENNEKVEKNEYLVLAFPRVQKRKAATRKYRFKFCVPRGGNCDHRPKKCCNGASCRCNLWGANCKCQRMGFFQKWGK